MGRVVLALSATGSRDQPRLVAQSATIANMTSQKTRQQQFMRYVAQRLPAHLVPAIWLQELLGISRDAAYRRLRGDSLLSISEYLTVCQAAGLPLGLWSDLSETSAAPDTRSTRDLGQDLRRLAEEVSWQHGPQTRATLASREIPSFHLFAYPELVAFRLYYWQRFLYQHPDWQTGTCDLAGMLPREREMIEQCQAISQQYRNCTVCEIWHPSMTSHLSQQLHFLLRSQLISASDALRVQKAFQAMLQALEQAARAGRFAQGGDYQLMFQTLHPHSHELLLEHQKQQALYIPLAQVGFVRVHDAQRVRQVSRWLQTIREQAQAWSGNDSPDRLAWFARWRRELAAD